MQRKLSFLAASHVGLIFSESPEARSRIDWKKQAPSVLCGEYLAVSLRLWERMVYPVLGETNEDDFSCSRSGSSGHLDESVRATLIYERKLHMEVLHSDLESPQSRPF